MVLLRDFAEERQVKSHTVATYIRRYPDLFDGHTGMDGNKMTLDETAVEILSKVYRPAPPEQDWKSAYERLDNVTMLYIDALERLNAATGKLNELQNIEWQYKSLQTEYNQRLLADTTVAVNEAVTREREKAEEEKAEIRKKAEVEKTKALERQQENLENEYQKRYENMTFGDFLKRKKRKITS